MWIIQWRGPNGRSPWRKAYSVTFENEAAAVAWMVKMTISNNSNFRTVER